MTCAERVAALSAKRSLCAERHAEAGARLDAARVLQTDIDAVQRTLQYIAARVQTEFGNFVGGVVTNALRYVFPARAKDSFVARFRENRGKTECQLLLVSAKGDAEHPFLCAGGGAWDIISFALCAAIVVLERPARTRFLALDEPFKNLHGSVKRRRALRMLYSTCDRLGIQAVAVHQSDGEDDSLDSIAREPGVRVYSVEQVKYELSKVTEVKA